MAALKNLIRRTKLWMQQVQSTHHRDIQVEQLADEPCFLRYIIETDYYLAELVIEPEGFHPHHHVELTALALEGEDISSYAYCYYDSEESTEDDIFACLDEAISYLTRQPIL